MTKQQLKRWYAIAFAFLLCLALFFPLVPKAVHAAAVTGKDNKFDDTNVLDDLRSSDGFDILKYPFLDSGKPEMYVINVVEYCYSFKANMRGNYALYLYLYNPGGQNIDTASKANKVQMAVAYDSEGKPNSYEKFDLQFCTKSEETNYKNLFYKFKIIDHASADGKTVLERVNSNARRYDISGVELQTYGATNATDYNVGGSYIFTGYAAGYGSDSGAENTLQCDVHELETIELDVRNTNFRTSSSATGKDHQNQLDSVYFCVDNSIIEKYGRLQKINAEWWEYKTAPIIVTQDDNFYSGLMPFIGTDIGLYSSNVPYHMGTEWDYWVSGSGATTNKNYNWSYNVRQSTGPAMVHSNIICSLIPYIFYTDGKAIKEYEVQDKEIKDWIYNYDKSFVNGYVPIKNKNVSADLFLNSVDNGRVVGHNAVTVDAGDKFSLLSYNSNHSWWDKVGDYGLWATLMGKTPNDEIVSGIKPIYMVTDADITDNMASEIMINENDVDDFKKYYKDAKANKKTTFLFRFAVTDYYSSMLHIKQDGISLPVDNTSYMAQETVFLDFDIIQLTFNRDGIYTVIPVVHSPIDIIGSITPPKDFEGHDWWKIFLMVLALILVVVLFAPILLAVLSFLIAVVSIPFKIIGALFRGIGNLFKRKKD